MAYMVHYAILKEFVELKINSQASALNYVMSVTVTFVLSYVVSIILSNILIKPIQLMLKKIKNYYS